MTTTQQGLQAITCAKYTREQFQRQFGDMLLMGLLSKGYATGGSYIAITEQGRRALADRG